MRNLLFLFGLTIGPLVFALDGFVLGGQVGQMGPLGGLHQYSNTIGFGLDAGVKTNPVLDLTASFQKAGMAGNPIIGDLDVFVTYLAADFHFFQFNDFDFSAGAGPGFYFLNKSTYSTTKFGLNIGGSVDVLVDESVRIGLGARHHSLFNEGTIWAVMMRASYVFNSN